MPVACNTSNEAWFALGPKRGLRTGAGRGLLGLFLTRLDADGEDEQLLGFGLIARHDRKEFAAARAVLDFSLERGFHGQTDAVLAVRRMTHQHGGHLVFDQCKLLALAHRQGFLRDLPQAEAGQMRVALTHFIGDSLELAIHHVISVAGENHHNRDLYLFGMPPRSGAQETAGSDDEPKPGW